MEKEEAARIDFFKRLKLIRVRARGERWRNDQLRPVEVGTQATVGPPSVPPSWPTPSLPDGSC